MVKQTKHTKKQASLWWYKVYFPFLIFFMTVPFELEQTYLQAGSTNNMSIQTDNKFITQSSAQSNYLKMNKVKPGCQLPDVLNYCY